MKKHILQNKRQNLLIFFVMLTNTACLTGSIFLNSYFLTSIVNKAFQHLLLLMSGQILLYTVFVFTNKMLRVLEEKATQSQLNVILKNFVEQIYTSYHQTSTGAKLSALTTDIQLLEEKGFLTFYQILSGSILALFSIGAILRVHWLIIVNILLFTTIAVFAPRPLSKILEQKTKNISLSNEKLSTKATEWFNHFDVLYPHNAVNLVKKILKIEFAGIQEAKVQFAKTQSNVNALLQSITILGQMSVFLLTAWLIIQNQIPIGSVLVTGNFSSQIFNTIVTIVGLFSVLKSSNAIFTKLENMSPKNDGVAREERVATIETIQLENVIVEKGNTRITFPNLTFEKNKKYAILGESGCGKSTLLKILAGFEENYQGNVLVNRKNLRDLNQQAYFKQYAFMEQDAHFVSGTLEENVTLFGALSNQDLPKYLALVNLHEWHLQQNHALDTLLSGNAENLSGGQKQRFSLTRELLKHAEILLIDEGTSAIDPANAKEIERRLLELEDKMILFVTHHLTEESKELFDGVIQF